MFSLLAALTLLQVPPSFEAELLSRLKADGFDTLYTTPKSPHFGVTVAQSKGPLKLNITGKFFTAPRTAKSLTNASSLASHKALRRGVPMITDPNSTLVPWGDANGAYEPTKTKLKSGETVEKLVVRGPATAYCYRANLKRAYVYVTVANADQQNRKPISESKADKIGKEALEDFAASLKK